MVEYELIRKIFHQYNWFWGTVGTLQSNNFGLSVFGLKYTPKGLSKIQVDNFISIKFPLDPLQTLPKLGLPEGAS